MITYDDFSKVSLKVGKIIGAERVEGSEKLLRLLVDVGEKLKDEESGEEKEKPRQVVAGIGKRYTPEELVDTYIVIVGNLAPRKLMGLESQGMLLAADSEDGPVLLRPSGEVVPGAEVR